MIKQFGNHTMPETGDNVAKDFGVTRQDADELPSLAAEIRDGGEEGFYKGEIHAIVLPAGKKIPRETVSVDEHPRRDSSLILLPVEAAV